MPDHELYCNPAVHESGKRDHRAVAAEVGAEFPDGTLLADILRRPGCAEFLPAVLGNEGGRELDGRRETCKEHCRESDRGGRRDSGEVSELEARTEGRSERICLFFALCELMTIEKAKITMWTRDHTLRYCESDG